MSKNNLELDSLEVKHREKLEVYMDVFKMNAVKTDDLLAQHPALLGKRVQMNDVQASAAFLLEKGFTTQDLIKQPMILLTNRITLMNRNKVLEECLFKERQMLFLYRFITVMNRNVQMLKAFNYIERNAKVPEHILSLLDVSIKLKEDNIENMSLNELRKTIINLYLTAKLGMSEKDIEKLWKVYNRLRHRSFDSIMRVINLLEKKFHFEKARIIKNGFLIHACPDNMNKMLEIIPSIAGVPIQEVLYKRPKVIMMNAESVKMVIRHIVSFDIPEHRILKCIEILTLSPDTVYERLVQLTKIKEFNVLCGHPRVLRLIHYQNKATTRLEYLKQLKVKCASLHVLSSASDTFERYAREGVDRTKGRDVVHYLAKIFKMDKKKLRSVISRHPNWCHIPVLSIKSAIDYLRYKKFTLKEISENLTLLLYPVPRIEQKLSALVEWKEENNENQKISGVALSAISNSKLLCLCLYYIESEFHFSGDGVWDMNRPDKQDLFPTTVPDFPKSETRDYRYGKKQPTATST